MSQHSAKGVYHPYLYCGWYYIVRGSSTKVYMDIQRGEVIASKDLPTIQRIPSRLNAALLKEDSHAT